MLKLVGNTPMVRLKTEPRVFVKLEKNNPWGSVKDRPALFMIEAAEKKGLIKSGVIVEPTSGNTGIALAAIGALKGFRVILTMPESVSQERVKILKGYGAEVVLTPAERGMTGAVEKALEIVRELDAYMPNQFENPYNVLAHETTTAHEILTQMNYRIDAFVAGVGTGGTITGVGKVLKKLYGERVMVVAVEPASSPVLSKGVAGSHRIQGIGAGFVPKILDLSVVDRIETVTDDEAFETVKLLMKKEALALGISSGANVAVALRIAQQLPEDARVVTIAPDGFEKYLSVFS
ncbi:cysteine synthase [Thermotoga sp. Ku-13t]|uniref:cysteine synthase A n=1 Tax=Thermotoga sp. Ku-13t TaxID=1755813 RepID=UPI0013ECF0C5|nr:cysteine synthase A [Thermotoga sp. Ku-13t]KAF2957955.1 cysteine synthase [Thermotoga sp. Ku-13t]